MEAIELEQRSSPFFRIATWGLGVLLVVVITGVVIQQFGFVASHQQRTIEDVVSHFRHEGLAVGTPQDLDDTLGAQRRVRVDVDGRTVEILEFNTADVDQAARLDQIRQSGSLLIEGSPQPVEVNAKFVLTGYGDHPRANDLTRSGDSRAGSIMQAPQAPRYPGTPQAGGCNGEQGERRV